VDEVCSTILIAEGKIGDKELVVASKTGCAVGDIVEVGYHGEMVTIENVSSSPNTDEGGTLFLEKPLAKLWSAGTIAIERGTVAGVTEGHQVTGVVSSSQSALQADEGSRAKHQVAAAKCAAGVGIWDGAPKEGLEIVGSCEGKGDQVQKFICGGENNFIKFDRPDMGKKDFAIDSLFKVNEINATGLSFVLWSGKRQFHIGLDGENKKLFLHGGSWGDASLFGATPLRGGADASLRLVRSGENLRVFLDGKETSLSSRGPIQLAEPITAFGWRPWRNEIAVQELTIGVSHFKATNKATSDVPRAIV
jgi:hypothetical protein